MAEQTVLVTEVGTRDGFQMEPAFVPTAEKIEILNALVAAGVRRIEATSFVSPRAVPQLADAEQVVAGMDRPEGLVVTCLAGNERGAARAAAVRVDEITALLSCSESHCRTNLNKSLAEALDEVGRVAAVAKSAGIKVHGALAMSFGCPVEGNVPAERLADLVERLAAFGIPSVTLGDSTGMATPPIVEAACRAVAERTPDIEVTLHFHNTRGLGLVNVMTGLDLGIRRYEAAFGGLGGCPFTPGATGNVCTEDLVHLLHELGYRTGIDLTAMMEISQRVGRIFGRELPGLVAKAGPRLRRHDEQGARRAFG